MTLVEEQLEVRELVEQVVRSVSCETRRPEFKPDPPSNQLGDLWLVIPPLTSIRPPIEITSAPEPWFSRLYNEAVNPSWC